MKWIVLCGLSLFAAAALALAVNGCSVICFGLGAAVDAEGPDTITVSAWKTEEIKPGASVRVILENGTEVSGKYRGTDRISEQEYADKYAGFREQKKQELILPLLGDSIAVTVKSGSQEMRRFMGFDYRYVTIEPEEETPTSIAGTSRILAMRTEGDTTSGFLLVSDIDQILDARGNVVEVESLQRLASTGQVPVYAAIAVEDSLGERLIPIHEIDEIVAPKKKTAKWVGLALGLGIDFVILASILSFEVTVFGDQD